MQREIVTLLSTLMWVHMPSNHDDRLISILRLFFVNVKMMLYYLTKQPVQSITEWNNSDTNQWRSEVKEQIRVRVFNCLVSVGHLCDIQAIYMQLMSMWCRGIVTSHGDGVCKHDKRRHNETLVLADTSNLWLTVYLYSAAIAIIRKSWSGASQY